MKKVAFFLEQKEIFKDILASEQRFFTPKNVEIIPQNFVEKEELFEAVMQDTEIEYIIIFDSFFWGLEENETQFVKDLQGIRKGIKIALYYMEECSEKAREILFARNVTDIYEGNGENFPLEEIVHNFIGNHGKSIEEEYIDEVEVEVDNTGEKNISVIEENVLEDDENDSDEIDIDQIAREDEIIFFTGETDVHTKLVKAVEHLYDDIKAVPTSFVSIDELKEEIVINDNVKYIVFFTSAFEGMAYNEFDCIEELRKYASHEQLKIAIQFVDKEATKEIRNIAFGYQVYLLYEGMQIELEKIMSDLLSVSDAELESRSMEEFKEECEISEDEEAICNTTEGIEIEEATAFEISEYFSPVDEIEFGSAESFKLLKEVQLEHSSTSNKKKLDTEKIRARENAVMEADFEAKKQLENEIKKARAETEKAEKAANDAIANLLSKEKEIAKKEELLNAKNKQIQDKEEKIKELVSNNASLKSKLEIITAENKNHRKQQQKRKIAKKSQRIGIISLSRGAGATTTTVYIANELADKGYKIVIVSLDKDIAYADLHRKIKLYTMNNESARDVMLEAMAAMYDYIIVDFGMLYELNQEGKLIIGGGSYISDKKDLMKEFLACEYKIAIGFSALWHIGKINYIETIKSDNFFVALENANSTRGVEKLGFSVCDRSLEAIRNELFKNMD